MCPSDWSHSKEGSKIWASFTQMITGHKMKGHLCVCVCRHRCSKWHHCGKELAGASVDTEDRSHVPVIQCQMIWGQYRRQDENMREEEEGCRMEGRWMKDQSRGHGDRFVSYVPTKRKHAYEQIVMFFHRIITSISFPIAQNNTEKRRMSTEEFTSQHSHTAVAEHPHNCYPCWLLLVCSGPLSGERSWSANLSIAADHVHPLWLFQAANLNPVWDDHIFRGLQRSQQYTTNTHSCMPAFSWTWTVFSVSTFSSSSVQAHITHSVR